MTTHFTMFPGARSGADRFRRDGIDRYEGYVDQYGRPVELIYGGLEVDGEIGRQGGRVVDISGLEHPNLDPRTGCFVSRTFGQRPSTNEYRRSLSNKSLNPLLQRSDLVNCIGDLSLAPRTFGNWGEAKAFSVALKDLHRKLREAEEFYVQFQDEYDGDVINARNYASANVLGQLWTLKVTGINDPHALLEDGISEEEKYKMAETSRKFEEKKREMKEVLRAVVQSTSPDIGKASKSQVFGQCIKRLREKVEVASYHIIELLELAPHGREHCQSLIHELQALTTLINSDEEINRKLFKYNNIGVEDNGEEAGAHGVSGEQWDD